MYRKKLGIFVSIPVVGEVMTRLVPPLSAQEACELYEAFVADFFARISKLKKVSVIVFCRGGDPAALEEILPYGWSVAPQEGLSPGERVENAFRVLLEGGGEGACVVGPESPDLPLVYIKRAYVKLKHRDLVFGPTFDGGHYLAAVSKPIPGLFRDVAWGTDAAFREAMGKVKTERLTCAVLPPWYTVATLETLRLCESMLAARAVEGRDRLLRVERALESVGRRAR